MLIKIKKYEHFNRAMGKYIGSKRQYQNEMSRRGLVSFEKGERRVEKFKNSYHKDYKGLSSKAQDIIRHAKQIKDNRGNIKLGDRAIEAMKKLGVNFGRKPDATN